MNIKMRVSEGLTKLENTLRTITNVSGGAVSFKDMAFFEHINLDTSCIYYAGKVMGSDGEYVLGVFEAKIEKSVLPPEKPKEETGGQILYNELCGRLIRRILEFNPDEHDIELNLCGIIAKAKSPEKPEEVCGINRECSKCKWSYLSCCLGHLYEPKPPEKVGIEKLKADDSWRYKIDEIIEVVNHLTSKKV